MLNDRTYQKRKGGRFSSVLDERGGKVLWNGIAIVGFKKMFMSIDFSLIFKGSKIEIHLYDKTQVNAALEVARWRRSRIFIFLSENNI